LEAQLSHRTSAYPVLRKFFFIISISLSLLIVLSVARAQEAITFPPLTGEYAVGQVDYYFIDTTRPETFTDDPDDVRELMTTIFYPAEAADDSQHAPYGNEALMAEASQWPGIDAEGWSQIETGLLSGVPLAAAPEAYPVILLSPGLGTPPLYYTSLLAEIVSHGYIAISISRTYTTALTVFPDGRVIRSNAAGTDVDGHESDVYADVLARRAAIGAVWAADISFVLDQLEALNQDDPLFGGHLDLPRVGLVGHSFGGSAGAEAAALDSRIGAVITMDSSLDGDTALNGLSQPYLFMEPANPDYEDPARTPTEEQLAAYGLTTDDLAMLLLRVNHMKILEESSAGYRLRLVGAQHLTFATDLHVFAPHFHQIGTVDSERALQIITQYTVAFYDQHLKGEDSPLLNTESTDPDVQFEAF
jgi:pimeloyl-ACP methyl ester carboxylesterase